MELQKTGTFDGDEKSLRRRVNEATVNIIAKEFALETVFNVEAEIDAKGYTVYIVPIAGSTAFANFLIKKF